MDENQDAEPREPDEDSFFERMLMDTAATLGWFEEEGVIRQLVDEAFRRNEGADDKDFVEVLAEQLRDWVDRAGAPSGACRTHPESWRDWLDGPHPNQTFVHWLMWAVIEDVDWWLLAELHMHRARSGR